MEASGTKTSLVSALRSKDEGRGTRAVQTGGDENQILQDDYFGLLVSGLGHHGVPVDQDRGTNHPTPGESRPAGSPQLPIEGRFIFVRKPLAQTRGGGAFR